jgi:hypothetical protein
MLTKCDQCGAENPAAANFCGQCGTPVSSAGLRSATRPTPLMQQWRRLKYRMTRREVRAILGEPARIDTAAAGSPMLERWTYAYERPGGAERLAGRIDFALPDGTVSAWAEPDWAALKEERGPTPDS